MLRALLPPLFAVALMVQTGRSQERTAPDKQFGIGLHTRGLSLQYAFMPAVQAGLHLTVLHTTSEGASATSLGGMPYVRLLHEGFVTPFIEAGVEVALVSSKAHYTVTTQWTTSVVALVGLEHYVARTLGGYIAVELLDARLDPAPTFLSVGIFRPRVGIEWFFGG